MADNVAAAKREATTADDTLRQKSRDPNVVSGGHLVAKTLKNEGVNQGALTQHMMGSLQDLPHVDIMRPVTKFA